MAGEARPHREGGAGEGPIPGASSRAPTPQGRSILGWILGTGLLLALVVLLERTVGWRALLAPWGEIPPPALAGACVLVMGSYLLRTARVHRYFHPDTRGQLLPLLRVMLLHNLFNNLLPARTGEASFPILMAKDLGIPLARSIPALLYLRVLDLHAVLFLGAGVLLADRGAAGWIALGALAPLPWIAFRGQEWLGVRLGTGEGRLRRRVATGLAGLPASRSTFWSVWGWTAVNWAAKLVVFAWVLRAFLPMPFPAALLGSVTGELSSILPVHGVAGAGTYEGGILAGLLPMGVEATSALAAAVNLHLFVLGVSLLSGALALVLPRGEARERASVASASVGPEPPDRGSEAR